MKNSFLIRTLLFLSCAIAFATAEEEQVTTPPTEQTSSPHVEEDIPVKEEEEKKDTFNAKDHTDWGSYYDPQNIFCGNYDCYSILGFKYEEFIPNTKEITKRYRALSREWHPDKSKHKDAKERFVVRTIARHFYVYFLCSLFGGICFECFLVYT